MPTTEVSQSTLDELGRLLTDACEKHGDSVSAIADRAHVPRPMVSAIKNGTYPNSPTLEKVEAILGALGLSVYFGKAKR